MDAGEDGKPAYIQLLGETLKELDVSVSHIVITHWHQDHLGGLNDVMELTQGTHTHTHMSKHAHAYVRMNCSQNCQST